MLKDYITPEGYAKLESELKYLWKVKRPEIAEKVKEAAAMGDRSENAEYIYGKKQLRETDRRTRYLNKRLEHLNVVQDKPDNREQVFFGARITVEDEQEKTFTYRIVGSDEIGDCKENISFKSPFAKAILGKHLDDEFSFMLGDKRQSFLIIKVDYDG
ncbi:MAG: transcription elongation factor GreB [Pseudomonadota bacterium]|nr:transcription elongation factor GreB [Pseudomonadota bacterium]